MRERHLLIVGDPHDISLTAATGYSHQRHLMVARNAGFGLLEHMVGFRQPSHNARQSAQENG
jgi:hypothetical protein